MGMKFRLRGLAETFIEEVVCPGCGILGADEEMFSTEHTKVTLEGIVVIAQCKSCGEIFVPNQQRRGIINPAALREAVERDSIDTGEPIILNTAAVQVAAERLNAYRKDDIH